MAEVAQLMGWVWDLMSAGAWSVWLVALLAGLVALLLHHITALRKRLAAVEGEAHDSRARFLAMLSHEIRSPLQAMLGSIDLLALKVQGAAEQRAIDRLRQAAAQLDTHLRDVTEYARLGNPHFALQLTPFQLAPLLHEVCERFQPAATAQGFTLHCNTLDLPPDTELTTDATRLRQILSKLLDNALKYTTQGSIRVSAHLPPAQPDLVCIEVADTGIGIPSELHAQIFEPYVRLDKARALTADGSGLGLAVVGLLVNRLGGHITLDSAPDQGARFTVCLPRRARQ